MRFFEIKIEITSDGVYRPINVWIDGIGCMVIFFFLARQLYFGKIPVYAAILFALLMVSIPIFKIIKYGKHGAPYIEKSSKTLTIFLPEDSRGKIRFDLDSLREIQVYGRLKRRKYRFLRQDGTFTDLTPNFREMVEQAVVDFLTANLPSSIGVKICEPQTFFAEVRGDGP